MFRWVRPAALFLLLLTPSLTFAQPIPLQNPFIPHRADPFIILHEHRYYFTASVPEYDRIELRVAKALADLPQAPPKVIWRAHHTGPMSIHIWAPELHFIDGKWYIYFAAGDADAPFRIRMYVLECSAADPLQGPWIEKGPIKTFADSFALDATTFTHQNIRYLVWAQHDPAVPSNTNLYLARMDTPWSVTGPQARLSMPEFPWEQEGFAVNEGPAVLIRHNRVFITYSASATDDNYCLGLLWADAGSDLLNPASWTKSPQAVFRTDEGTKQFGPGHNCFLTLPAGTDLLVYHARPTRELQGTPLTDPNRHTRVQTFSWTPEGFPVFGKPQPDAPVLLPPAP